MRFRRLFSEALPASSLGYRFQSSRSPAQSSGRGGGAVGMVISALDGRTKEQKLLLFACIREPNGVLRDLKPLPVPALLKVEGPLLRAFLTGYRLVQSSLPADPLERTA